MNIRLSIRVVCTALLICLTLLAFVSRSDSQMICTCDSCHGNPPINDTRGGPSGLIGYHPYFGAIAGAHSHLAKLQIEKCDGCHFGGMGSESLMIDMKLQIGFFINGKPNIGAIYYGLPNLIDTEASYQATNSTEIITSGPMAGTMQCANVYCHGGGTGGTNNRGGISQTSLLNNMEDPRPIDPSLSPAWNILVPIGCNPCHGIGTLNGIPSYPTDSLKPNGHPGHKDIACTCCHANTTIDSITISNVRKHHDGIYDVVPNSQCSTALGPVNFTYSYDPGGGKCSNVSCHGGIAGYWGAPTVGNSGATATLSTSTGSNCFQITATGTPKSSLRGLKPPYTYVFDWGDGSVTGPKTSNTIPITESHTYSAAGTANITFHYRDGGQIPASASAIIGVSGTNIDPTAGASMSVSGMTLTFTDASFDPDYNTCGHSGNGRINIFWASGVVVNEEIALTDQPSNNVYTYTFANPGTYNLTHAITDNAGKKVNNPMLLTVTVPTNFSVSGKITHAGGSAGYTPGQVFGGVSVEVRKKDGSYVKSASTNASGIYTISNIPGNQHYNLIPVKNYFTFSPASVDIYQNATNVDFVGTP